MIKQYFLFVNKRFAKIPTNHDQTEQKSDMMEKVVVKKRKAFHASSPSQSCPKVPPVQA